MKFLEELMNILFQEYGGLVLTIISIALSTIVIIAFANVVRNNLVIIKELSHITNSINEAVQ
nr:MAG: hypothetical protein TU36_01645 [Vulcanisaeta sp. AZ3]